MQFNKDVKKQILCQAVNEDYENSRYDRGHLAPVFQAKSQSCADATFTLTNAAPQNPSFNRGQWRVLEGNIAKELSDQCLPKKYSVYIVTGVVPGINNITNNVTVPSHFWTAYCCLDQNNRCQISGGVIGTNDRNSNIRRMSVAALEGDLKNLYGKTFQLFSNKSRQRLLQNKASQREWLLGKHVLREPILSDVLCRLLYFHYNYNHYNISFQNHKSIISNTYNLFVLDVIADLEADFFLTLFKF